MFSEIGRGRDRGAVLTLGCPHMNLASVLTDSAQRDPDHVALKLDDMEVSYGLLDEGSARLAAVLADRGVEPGDRVGIMLPNVPYFAVCYYGVLRAGGVVVPMNVLLKRREVAFYLGDSGAKLMFALGGVRRRREGGRGRGGRRLHRGRARRVRGDAGGRRAACATSSTASPTTPR